MHPVALAGVQAERPGPAVVRHRTPKPFVLAGEGVLDEDFRQGERAGRPVIGFVLARFGVVEHGATPILDSAHYSTRFPRGSQHGRARCPIIELEDFSRI